MRELLKARLSPFRHRNFQRFFIAQSLSLMGTWSHDLARSWIVVEATGSSGALGNLNTAIAVPCLFLILQGGVLVDRTDVRKLIQWTKTLLGISGCVLACLAEFTHLHMWELLIFALIEGVITAYDSPAFAALTVRLVPRADFQQAIALNSTNFHTSRMLGPIIAAWLMSFHGPSLVFLFDGLTYFLVAYVLSRVRIEGGAAGGEGAPTIAKAMSSDAGPVPGRVGRDTSSSLRLGESVAARTSTPPQPSPPSPPSQQPPPSQLVNAMRAGFRYMFGSPALRYRILQLLLTIGCVHPMMIVIFRVFVQKKFALNAHQFREVFSFPAMGSMAGALIFAFVKPKRPIRALLIGIPLVCVMLLAMPLMQTLPWTVATMSLAGFGLYLTFASLTVSMQLEVEEAYRGRLSSVIGLGFSALGPLMSFPWGHLADFAGPPRTIQAAAILFAVGSAYLAWDRISRDRTSIDRASRI